MQEVFSKIIEKLEEYEYENLVEHDSEQSQHCKDAGDCKGMDCSLCVFNKAIEIVKQEAEKYDNGWIPCSERLQKYGEVVMCSCTNSGITISCITHKGVKPSKSVRFGQHSVIAWQPLPQPYQPSGNHKKKTNFDICCESMESMAQIIDIAKIGWTKEQIMEWLQKEECEVPE